MKLTSLHIENFRSIRSLHLDNLGAINVFYGENGAGKSNILAALDRLFRAMERAEKLDAKKWPWVTISSTNSDTYKPGAEDYSIQATFSGNQAHHVFVEYAEHSTLSGFISKFTVQRKPSDAPVDASAAIQNNTKDAPVYRALLRELSRSFRLLPPVRVLGTEAANNDPLPKGQERITTLLGQGRLKQVLVEAMVSPDLKVRAGLQKMRKTLEGPPLYRPPFDPIFDPNTNTYELSELYADPQGAPYLIPVDLAGLGIQQIYHIMAGALLGDTQMVAIEEPEAHLHPRTSGRHLRTLLKRLIDEGMVSQLFIATHSNLFDLDPSGYFNVRRDAERGTVVERRTDFSNIDREHLYEPGPARHAIQDMLRYLPPETPIFRNAAGDSISAQQMLTLLIEDAPDAVAFLDDVHAAAVRSVQRLARRT